jgi:hypothetical protein
MKKFYSLKFFFLTVAFVLAAFVLNAQTRTATASGNWNSTTTWGGASVPASANDVVINPGVTVTVNVAAAACNSITFTAGTTGSTITISGTNALSVTGAVTINGTTVTTGNQATLITVGGGSLSCASLAFNPNAGNLNSNNRRSQVTVSTGTVTVSGNISCSGDVVSAGGSTGISFSSTGTLNVGGNFYTSPNFGDFTVGTSTVNYNGVNQAVLDATYEDLTISGSGTKTISAATVVNGTLTLSGGTLAAGTNLSMSTGGIPTLARSGGSMTGTLQTNNDYVVNYSGLSKTTGQELSGTGLRDVTVAVTAGETVTLDQNRAPDGNLSVTSGTFDLSTFTINRSAAGGTLTLSSGATLKIGGTNSFPGNYNTHSVSSVSPFSTVEYAGTAQSVATLNSVQSYGNLTISGSGVKSFTGETVNGVLSVQGTATTAGTSPVYGAAAILEYKGSGAQNTSNVEFVGTGANPVNLRIDNTNGVTLNAIKSINGALTLTNGYLTTTTNLLTISATGSATTANNSFVNGPLAKTGNSAFTFPVGKVGAGVRTIGISAPATATTIFTAEFFRADAHTLSSTYGAGINQVSACEYWSLNRAVNANNVSVTLSWASGSSCSGAGYVSNMATLRVARLNAGTWTSEGNLSTGGSNTAGTVISGAAVTTFNTNFVLATSAPDNALPVMFGEVKAYEKNSGVQIDWNNLTERDLVNYYVEHSTNGQDFTTINTQLPKSNRNDAQSYTAFDASPNAGTNFYRIRVLEISGKIIYSKILKVDIGGKQQTFTLYPNPVSGGQVSVSLNVKQGQYMLKVLGSSGQEVYSQKITHQGGSMTQAIQLPASVKPGFYNMVVSGDNYRESKMFIVQ